MTERLTTEQVIAMLVRKITEAGSAARVAEQIGVSPAYLSYVVNGYKIPSETICEFLGVRRVRVAQIYYERIK